MMSWKYVPNNHNDSPSHERLNRQYLIWSFMQWLIHWFIFQNKVLTAVPKGGLYFKPKRGFRRFGRNQEKESGFQRFGEFPDRRSDPLRHYETGNTHSLQLMTNHSIVVWNASVWQLHHKTDGSHPYDVCGGAHPYNVLTKLLVQYSTL